MNYVKEQYIVPFSCQGKGWQKVKRKTENGENN